MNRVVGLIRLVGVDGGVRVDVGLSRKIKKNNFTSLLLTGLLTGVSR